MDPNRISSRLHVFTHSIAPRRAIGWVLGAKRDDRTAYFLFGPVWRTGMVNALAGGAVVLVVLLFGLALFAFANGDYATAGVTFLSASIAIYLRETYLLDG